VGESCYHRWTILAFCVLSKSEEINARKKRKVRKEACVGWLLPAITARTAIKMEEWRRGCLTVLSCQLPNCLLSRAYLFNLRNQHFFHGPILKCSFLKTSSFHVPRLFFLNLIFIFLFKIIYKINYFLNFIILQSTFLFVIFSYFLINFKTKLKKNLFYANKMGLEIREKIK